MSATDELRELAGRMDGLVLDTPDMLREAADAIDVLQESVRRLMTQRNERLAKAEAENDKLRELLLDMLMSPQEYCEKYGIEYEGWSSADDHIDARMRELGVVDDG